MVTETNFAGVRELSEPTSEQSLGQHSEQDSELLGNPYSNQAPEQSGRIIAFPRSAAIPVFRPSGLADPVFDHSRPRIVEAPEILPPPPALGGMLIEPAHREPIDTRSGESPNASVSLARRLLAALIDGAILALAVTAFVAIFLHPNPSRNLSLDPSLHHVRGSLPLLAGLGVVVIALWAAYQFLFVVYTGSTPGLRATRLRLASFDGSPLGHRARRWRVLASISQRFPWASAISGVFLIRTDYAGTTVSHARTSAVHIDERRRLHLIKNMWWDDSAYLRSAKCLT